MNAQAQTAQIANHPQQQARGLFPFVGNPRDEVPKGLPFQLTDYLELVDISGRILRDGMGIPLHSQGNEARLISNYHRFWNN